MSLEAMLGRVVAAVGAHYAGIRDLPVVPSIRPEEIRAHLESRYGDFASPQPPEDVIGDVVSTLQRWNVHVTHPRYFGLFNPSVLPAGMAAEALVAAFNPQLAAWSHAPGANEIERFTLEHLLRTIGFDPAASAAHFTSGGAEANLTAVITALAHAAPEYGEIGVEAFPGQPLVYLSEESHHSFEKIVRMAGLGRRALRRIPVDAALRLEPGRLEAMMRADREAGCFPIMIVGTAGTTSAGVIDPLPELARIATAYGLWFHVDAAWGGGALLSPTLRPHLEGIEMADSGTWDAHKWLSVPMGAGMFLCRHPDAVRSAFAVHTGYMPGVVGERMDPYLSSVQWSRRFIGLKLFMTLAELGREGYADLIEHQCAMGDLLRRCLQRSGWRIVNDTPLPVVCFSRGEIERGEVSTAAILERIYREGDVWISTVRLPGGDALRACITSFRTEPQDLDHLVRSLGRALA